MERPLLHMDTAILVALIAAFASLLATLSKVIWDAVDKRRELRASEQSELRRYRSRLFGAADDLGNRIGNIRSENFFYYLEAKDGRATIALRSTLFRFGQYFTWAEIYREYLRLNPDKDPGEVPETLDWITATLATDEPGPQLMLWREEQSAIADEMRKTAPMPECIGFSSFTADYETRYASWFQRFEKDLMTMSHPPRAADSQRLVKVQAILARLVVQLDVEKALVKYKDGQIIAPRWAQPTELSELAEE